VTNGARITSYVVTPYREGCACPPRTFASPATAETVTGLNNGASYEFKVAAKNSRGTSVPSKLSAYVTVGTPSAPTQVSVAGDSCHSGYAVSWTAPNDNGSPITAYVVVVGGVPFKTFYNNATTEIVDLAGDLGGGGDGSITFAVAAHNKYGLGAPSDPYPYTPPICT
jgi:hypothetical protein